MAKPAKRPTEQFSKPCGVEIGRALDLIAAGKSDAGIAATIGSERPHGQFRVHPKHIAELRDGR